MGEQALSNKMLGLGAGDSDFWYPVSVYPLVAGAAILIDKGTLALGIFI